jgi:peptide/nickel transport system permease protein
VPPILKYFLRRLMVIPVTFFLVTAALYGVIMLTPPETRAQLYLSGGRIDTQQGLQRAIARIIEERGLDDPYPVQYSRWISNVLRGDWGWSPVQNDDVLRTLLRRTPATAELTLYSILLLAPLGLASGVIAGWKENRRPDHIFRSLAFVATSVPPFILGLLLLTIFYAGLRWFPPGRLGFSEQALVTSSSFKTITGLLTIDGLLNGQSHVSREALRHLVLPVITLSLAHWATLGRVTRAAIIEELGKPYIVAARGRGLSTRRTVWFHALRNALLPALNSSALSAASLVTGVFVVEVVFAFPGVSEPITNSLAHLPDTAMAMGFAVYSVLVVLPLMIILDVLQVFVDPRMREGGVGG